MSAARPPKTLAAATALLEHYAELAQAAAHIEFVRNAKIAQTNASADAELGPLREELEALATRLQPWWLAAGVALASGKKSVQLGGCKIGTRAGKPKLTHPFEKDDAAIAALSETRWFKQTTKISYRLDRTGAAKLIELGGKAGEDLKAIGFRLDKTEVFFVEAARQEATIAP